MNREFDLMGFLIVIVIILFLAMIYFVPLQVGKNITPEKTFQEYTMNHYGFSAGEDIVLSDMDYWRFGLTNILFNLLYFVFILLILLIGLGILSIPFSLIFPKKGQKISDLGK